MLNQNLTPNDASFNSLDAKVLGGGLKQALLDLFYPVNTLYLTDDENFNPNSAWGGTWKQLDGGYSLMTVKADGTDGYQMLTTRADNHVPGTNSQGGLPDISGSLSGLYGWEWSASGAFSKSWTNKGPGGNSYANCYGQADFEASKSSNRYGVYQGKQVSVIPDHHATIVWKRTA